MVESTAVSAPRATWPVAVLVLLLVPLGACGDPGREPPGPADGRLVAASFNFPESRLLTEIYAQALEGAGIPVRRELDLGSRELVGPALRQGLVDLVPEYLGSALAAAAPDVAAATDLSDEATVVARLADAVSPWGLELLAPAPAQNQNGLVVTRETADLHGLAAVSDLRAVAPSLDLGGPPECPTRRHCLVGLADVYGLAFGSFVPLAEEGHVRRALEEGVIDVGVLFTTDGSLAQRDLVLLADDRNLQPVENVVPLVRADALARYAGAGPGVAAVIDRVSARLDTATLRFLNWRVTVAGKAEAAEAAAWLRRSGLLAP